nr:PREDICTED: E3 ubiquitin-protein ligase UBR5 isoform X3 [Bemisia tabaci]
MSSLQFVVHPIPGTDDQVNDRLKEVSDRLNRFGQTSQIPTALSSLKVAVKQIAVGPNHFALLLEDGRVCRVAFSIISDRLDLSKADPNKQISQALRHSFFSRHKPGSGGGGGSSGGGGGGGGGGAGGSGSATSNGGGRQLTRTRARIMRTSNSVVRGGITPSNTSRTSSSVIMGSGSISNASSRPMVPAPVYVPEELVSQAQVVLQGKSRNLIVRELQRTNLDVNLAVNNLLSRDDEEGDEGDDGGDSYVPEDLISLLDGGFHTPDHSVIIDAESMFSEDMFGYPPMRNLRGSSSSSRRLGSTSERDRGDGADRSDRDRDRDRDHVREHFSRWRGSQYFGPRRWLETALRDSSWDKDSESKKKELAQQSPLWMSDDVEFWSDYRNPYSPVPKFVAIASLYSELIALSSTGQLHQWKWNEPEPYRNPENQTFHPKTIPLGLASEKILHLSACTIRCSVAAESGKVATWLDELLSHAATSKLEHPAQSYTEFSVDPIVSLHTCSLYTVARLESGALYWWGVYPFAQRKKLWEKFRAKSHKQRPSSSNGELVVGSQVCMKNSPMYQAKAIGFCISNGVPKVGQLLNAAWNLNDVCRFQILSVPQTSSPTTLPSFSTSLAQSSIPSSPSSGSMPEAGASRPSSLTAASLASKSSLTPSQKENSDRLDMPPPPSPASSTCSDTPSTSHKRPKRVAPKDNNEDSEKKDEEEWSLNDVIFIDDMKTLPIGRVVKIDGIFAAVKLSSATSNPSAPAKDAAPNKEQKDPNAFNDETISILQDCRLLRKDELQVIKNNMTSSRAVDCFQRTPRRISIPDSGNQQLLTVAVDGQGVHAIVKTGSKVSYMIYNVTNGKIEQDSPFPSDTSSLLGLDSSQISFYTTGSSTDSVFILRDGNSNILPLAKDSLDSMRDAQWLDLPAIKCVGAGTHALSSVQSSDMKNQAALIILAIDTTVLMSHILRCQIDNVKSVIQQLEVDKNENTIKTILNERCDGNRNIIHACVSMCMPTSNKENETADSSTPSSGLESINVITNALGSRSVSLREMMRRASVAVRMDRGRSSDNASSGASALQSNLEDNIPSLWPTNEMVDTTSGDEDSLLGANKTSSGTPPFNTSSTPSNNVNNNNVVDPVERRINALAILKLICESHVLQPHLVQLLSAKDSQGQTPFMLALSVRAYQAAKTIYSTIDRIVNKMPPPPLVLSQPTTPFAQEQPPLVDDLTHYSSLASGNNTTPTSNPSASPNTTQHKLKCVLSAWFAKDAQPVAMNYKKTSSGSGEEDTSGSARQQSSSEQSKAGANNLSSESSQLMESMIFPPGSNLDLNPLHIICCNDTCSFTWTGDVHINQDIFECRTCGLIGTLCCCTECARVCHRGHDCKIKRTAPTAYCDCWEKGKCKALVQGNQNLRFSLLCTLSSETDLVLKPNSRGENILLFLAQTVSRQTVEQRQYRTSRSRSTSATGSRKTPAAEMDTDVPEHDLEPPRFSRNALAHLLSDWLAVKSMILSGIKDDDSNSQKNSSNGTSGSANVYSDHMYLNSQNGTALLDKFTHCLLVKCSADMLDVLLATLIRELQNTSVPGRQKEATLVARRFVRSVARIFVVFSVEMAPASDKRRGINNMSAPLVKCKRVFQSLVRLSVEELAETADSLIAPVRLGVARPTAPFSLSSSAIEVINSSEELFSVEPLAPNSGSSLRHSSDISSSVGLSSSAHVRSQVEFEDFEDSLAALANENEGSDTEEGAVERGAASGNGNGEPASSVNNEVGGGNDVESDTEDLMVESESDSDQSNQDGSAQRSVQTGATAGSDAEDDSGESTQQEDEESETGETDDMDNDELVLPDEQLERRSTSNGTGQRSNLAPQSMQWAIRTRDSVSRSAGFRVSSGQSVVLIDPTTLRRANTATSAVTTSTHEPITMATTASCLARAFGIVVRQITDLLVLIHDYSTLAPSLPVLLETNMQDLCHLQSYLEGPFKPTWDWMLAVMDSTEAQLRFGASLTHSSEPSHPAHPLHSSSISAPSGLAVRSNPNSLLSLSAINNNTATFTTNAHQSGSSNTHRSSSSNNATNSGVEQNPARREFLSYCLSLMRSHNAEHADSLPVLDVSALKHVAYVLDALIYYIRAMSGYYHNKMDSLLTSIPLNTEDPVAGEAWNEQDENENEENDDDLSHSVMNMDTDSTLDEQEAALGATVNLITAPTVSSTPAQSSSLSSSGRGRKHVFFQRSDSTLCLGCPPPDPFDTPMAEALPLADQPHLLQPNARKQDLFGTPKQAVTVPVTGDGPPGLANPLEVLPTRLGLSSRKRLGSCYASESSNTETVSKTENEISDDKGMMAEDSPHDLSVNKSSMEKPATADASTATPDNDPNKSVPMDVDPSIVRAPIIVAAPSTSSQSESFPSSGVLKSVIVRAGPAQENFANAFNETASPSVSFSEPAASASDASKEGNAKYMNSKSSIPIKPNTFVGQSISHDLLLGRWRLSLDLFGRVFMEDVGLEPGSVVSELGGFPVKEAKFRREMEKLRNIQNRDFTLKKMERDRVQLIQTTFKELNALYHSRRSAGSAPPLAVNRVKVTFKDEPGEGSGVARSFYTAIAEALLANEKFPTIETTPSGSQSADYSVLHRIKSRDREHRRLSTNQRSGGTSWSRCRESRRTLSFDAQPFTPSSSSSNGSNSNNANADASANGVPPPASPNHSLSDQQQQYGDRLYQKVHALRPSLAGRITGMLLELSPAQVLTMLSSDDELRQRVDDAMDILLHHGDELSSDSILELETTDDAGEDNAPLFYCPGKTGFYSPRQGKATFERLSAFRNTGRLLGLCLLQNELCPMFLNRHVIKCILGRPVRFHDLAFFDPIMYEGLRQLVVDAESKDANCLFSALELNFSVDLSAEEGGGFLELVPGGRDIEVTASNVYDYVRKYAEYRMVKAQSKAIDAIRQGVFDVLPPSALDGLTPEDFRLLLNGVGDFNVSVLISYTNFIDESSPNPHEPSPRLLKLKRWLWSIVEKMTPVERMDLVYFWTGSPALPASEDGFQQMPSVTVRPPDDSYLPSANTCISRLYIPLYSSRSILRQKLMIAIKSKNFGFI